MLILSEITHQRTQIPLLFDDGRLCKALNIDQYARIQRNS